MHAPFIRVFKKKTAEAGDEQYGFFISPLPSEGFKALSAFSDVSRKLQLMDRARFLTQN